MELLQVNEELAGHGITVVANIGGPGQVEKVFVAEEVKTVSPRYLQKLLAVLEPMNCEVVFIPHAELKAMSQGNTLRASIRTGECTSYSTVILQAGVPYGGDDLT